MPSALLWASLAETLFWILQIRQGCGPAGFAFSREGSLREVASAAVGLRPKRSGNRCFYGTRSPAGSCRAATEGPFKSAEAENTVKRSSRRTGVNLQYFRVEPTSLGSERGEQPLFCNDDDRCLRQKQGGVVGAVASRMQGPLKGRSIRWEPQPVQGRGVSRGREGGVETPLSPSGPAERPRRRCRLQKPSGQPHAIALCMRNITKKHPPCGCTAGALKGSAGMLSGWCPCPQPGRRRSSQRPPRPSPGRGRSGAGPCWGCPGAC